MDGSAASDANDDDVEEIDQETLDAVLEAVREHADVLFSVAKKLTKNDEAAKALVADAVGDMLTKRRTRVPGVKMVTQLVLAIRTLWMNQVRSMKRRRSDANYEEIAGADPDAHGVLAGEQRSIAFRANVEKTRQDLGSDADAIHALEWMVEDGDERFAERARSLGIELSKFLNARKRAVYAAAKYFDEQEWTS